MRGLLLLSVLTSVACSACGDDSNIEAPPPCNAQVCDIREPDCQEAVQAIVQCFRGSDTEMPPVDVISEDEYRALFAEQDDGGVADEDDGGTDLGVTSGDLARVERVMSAFSLINLAPDEVELEERSDAFFDSVEVSYVIDQERVVVIDRGEALDSSFSVSTLAHEVVHGLHYREHDIEALRDARPDTLDSQLAFEALVEGEAMHFEVVVSAALAGVPPGGIDFTSTYTILLGGVYEDSYPLLAASARFPYAYGGRFMTFARLADGVMGVEAAFDEPPRSTGEIMRLQRLNDEAVESIEALAESSVPEAPSGFSLIALDALGAYLFDQFLVRNELAISFPPTFMIADRVSVFQSADGERTVLAWRLRFFGDTAKPTEAFVEDFRQALEAPDADAPEPGDDVRARVWAEDDDLIILVGDHALDAAWLAEDLVWGPDPK